MPARTRKERRRWPRRYGEEVYVVVTGRATFVCDGETLELGAGELLFVEPQVERGARALETPTTVLALGGVPGTFETWTKPDAP